MGLFSFFRSNKKPKKTTSRRFRSNIHLEPLEDRFLPASHTISGFVYHDVNGNGLRDPGEAPIANSQIELIDDQDVVVGSTTTDANGYYEFNRDDMVSPQPQTLSQTATFPSTQTNFSLQKLIDQFDDSLGTLESVEIIHEGAITSEIQVENTSPTSASTISGNVSGNMKLTGPGFSSSLELSGDAGSFDAALFDGDIDFDGTSGHSFGSKTVSGTKSIILTGSDLAPFIGDGKITLTEEAEATSWANGGGNLIASLNSQAEAKVTVVYTYVPSNELQPGDYVIVQKTQPPGFMDGQESRDGVILSNPPGVDRIPVTLVDKDLENNNFGEVIGSELSGFVFMDADNDGVRDPGESPIGGVEITLTGNDDVGSVSQTATTDASGFYEFTDLRPGTYMLSETQPPTHLDGKDSIGTQGGVVGDDFFSSIALQSGTKGLNNNFGELSPAELSGFVFNDNDNDGVREPGETGIEGVQVRLTGFDDEGAVDQSVTTDANGFYQFGDLRPGTYSLTESQPSTHLDGKDSIGTQGGIEGDDQFSDINLQAGVDGQNNNFGEVKPAELSGFVFHDANNNGVRDPGEQGIPGVSVRLTGTDGNGAVDKTVVTDPSGFYNFDNLLPGNYTITETQPNGFIDGTDSIGSQGGTAGDDLFTNISLEAGENGQNNNFGEIDPASLSGFVFADADNDGLRDPGESGISGVEVTLTGSDDRGSVNLTATTDANGI